MVPELHDATVAARALASHNERADPRDVFDIRFIAQPRLDPTMLPMVIQSRWSIKQPVCSHPLGSAHRRDNPCVRGCDHGLPGPRRSVHRIPSAQRPGFNLRARARPKGGSRPSSSNQSYAAFPDFAVRFGLLFLSSSLTTRLTTASRGSCVTSMCDRRTWLIMAW